MKKIFNKLKQKICKHHFIKYNWDCYVCTKCGLVTDCYNSLHQ